jgi:hypothetical protein
MTTPALMRTTEEIRSWVDFVKADGLYDVERWITPGKSFEGIIGKRNTLLQIEVETGFHSLVELIAKRERSQLSIRLTWKLWQRLSLRLSTKHSRNMCQGIRFQFLTIA